MRDGPMRDWPTRAVRVIVPFAPGGGTDLVARMTAQKLAERYGQPFLVENRSGAGGTLGSAVGVDVNEYLPAAKLGVTKINIDTDGRLVWTRVHREYFRDKPGEFDFRPPGKIFIDEYAKFIASRNQLLGSKDQLADLRKSLGK